MDNNEIKPAPAENSGPVDDKPVTGMPSKLWLDQYGTAYNQPVQGSKEYIESDLVQPSSEGVKTKLDELQTLLAETHEKAVEIYGGHAAFHDQSCQAMREGIVRIKEIRAALSNSVPEGMHLVPFKSGEAMRIAGVSALADIMLKQKKMVEEIFEETKDLKSSLSCMAILNSEQSDKIYHSMIAAHESEGG